ncbi:G-protein coupled receptor 54-like [Saccoglossus kowalevskii]|uniref:G-protein coupled receptor 54-like n=1 Tax=Saccoglossus kowalevskii TaxID=10224 RepID=A0ABM0MYC6_SACKO|nr:PREDICTED: G-protein coupled receptor 54-like [Saccoglossus kowalevskii]
MVKAIEATMVKVIKTTMVKAIETTMVKAIETTMVKALEPTMIKEIETTMVKNMEPTMVKCIARTIIEEIDCTMVKGIEPTVVKETGFTMVERGRVTVQATCITLTAMMVDRYYAIAHPLKSLKTRTPRVAMMVSASVWAASALCCVPVALYRQVVYYDWYGIKPFCVEVWPSHSWNVGWYVYMCLAAYLAPLLIISVCMGMIMHLVWNSSTLFYRTQSKAQQARQRQKIRKTRMVCVVVLIFAFCWLPVHIMNIWSRLDVNYPDTMVTYAIQLFGNCLSYANSCVNPIIYAFMSENFRRRFREVFTCCCAAPSNDFRFRERGTITLAMTDGKSFNSQTSTSMRRHHHCIPLTEPTIREASSTNPDTNDTDMDYIDALHRNTEDEILKRSVLA